MFQCERNRLLFTAVKFKLHGKGKGVVIGEHGYPWRLFQVRHRYGSAFHTLRIHRFGNMDLFKQLWHER